jgi:hypothetical protein
LNKKKKGQKSIIKLFNNDSQQIANNNTIENIFRMTNSFNEIKCSSYDQQYMLYYNGSDITQLINAPQVNSMRQLLTEVFPNNTKKVNMYREQLFNSVNMNDLNVNDIDPHNKYNKNDIKKIRNKITSLKNNNVNEFGGGKKSINLISSNKKYIKIKDGKRLLRIGPKGGKYYIKGGNKKYIT